MGNIQVLHLNRKSSSVLNRKAEKPTFFTHCASSWTYHEPLHGTSDQDLLEYKEQPQETQEEEQLYYSIKEPTSERVTRLCQDEPKEEDKHNEAKTNTIKETEIICSICNYQAESVPDSHKHNIQNHNQILSKEEGNVTTCVLCLFVHENTSAVKLHTEVAHNARYQKLFVKHKRGTNVYTALEEQQKEELFNASIKRFYHI